MNNYTRATDAQMRLIGRLVEERVIDAGTLADITRRAVSMTRAQASGTISFLMARPRKDDGSVTA